MSTRPLPVSTPAAEGVDARGVDRFLQALEHAPQIDPHGLVVLRHGRVVARGWWAPYATDRVQLLYSLSKSFTATALGLAVAEGVVGLDDRVVDAFPELDAEVTDPRTRSMLVRHLASMATGHVAETWDRALAGDRAEPVRGFLLLPPDQEPGSVFAYNQSATYTLAAILQRATGQSLTDYLRPRLFDLLGIDDTAWQQHPAGRDLGFSGLHATTDAVARLGQLHLQRGAWDGVQLLPAEWVDEATAWHIATPQQDGPDWQQGYGYQFWQGRHGYRGDGAFGQFCLVLPDADAVVAVTAGTPDLQGLLDAVWEHLLPALTAGAAPDGADEALARRLSDLALPPLDERPAPPGDPAAWDGATFVATAAARAAQWSLDGVAVAASGDAWEVTFTEAGTALTARLGTGGWAVSEPPAPGGGVVPLAVSGGWTADGDLRVDVLFLETPHRLALTCSLAAGAEGTADARWVTGPLWGSPLAGLRAPR